ncbi:MAG: hypothetical protein ACRDNZ_10445 [Streptosporangiaceae bacterium]
MTVSEDASIVLTTPHAGGDEQASEPFSLASRHGQGQPVPGSRDPAGGEQEMWALLVVYQTLCKIIGIGVTPWASRPPGSASRTL